MNAHPAYTLGVGDVVELEQRIATAGTSLYELMQQAGGALADAVEQAAPEPCRICILVGSGNNGGDGWVAAEILAQTGYDVVLVAPKPARDLAAEPARTAALHALDVAPSLEVRIAPSEEELAELLGNARVAIDALLGTGFSGDTLKEPYASWITALEHARNSQELFVIAADVPSGVSAQTAAVAQPHVTADQTVTMMVLKPGLLAYPGATACGTVLVADICDLSPFEDFLEQRNVGVVGALYHIGSGRVEFL